MTTTLKGRMRVYACGGAGLNIGQQLERYRGKEEVGFAAIEVAYVDTSRSNLAAEIDAKHCYLLEDLDGSGKIRAENHAAINEHVRAVLQQFRPADINIVLSSAAGGSGSVFGPLLASQLLADDQCVLAVTIGSADTKLDAENTLKTLKSYESIARMRGKPIVMAYVENSREQSRSRSDDIVIKTIAILSGLFSRENRELDSRDLYNWLHFDRVTSFEPQLGALHLVETTNVMPATFVGNVVSVATLACEGTETAVEPTPEVQFTGFIAKTAEAKLKERAPIHFVVTDGFFNEVGARLQSFLKERDQAQQARVARKPLLTSGDRAETSGLVL